MAALPPVTRHESLSHLLRVLVYPLALLRLPYAILPYLCRTVLYLGFQLQIGASGEQTWFEALRVLGDFCNWLLTSWILLNVLNRFGLAPVLGFPFLLAEAVRLLTEKGVMVWSGIWQHLPHRRIAANLRAHPALSRRFDNYQSYYALDDSARLGVISKFLSCCSEHDTYLAQRLSYVKKYRIVPNTQPLRAGHVRDVARGEIFIHPSWTNDPYLLIGQALRRSPWIFDPRWLPRPFYYRTQANPLVTAFVLEYASMSPPFALFQFGHEIKAARYELFFRFARACGWELEEVVGENGMYEFDPL